MQVNYDNYREKLGKAVLAKREETCLTQKALAAKIKGVCSKTIERIETGNYPKDMSLFAIQSVCSELKLSVKFSLGVVL